jgi:hypothetical protein
VAKVVITIEDVEGDHVKVTATPNFEQMCKLDLTGQSMTSAHGFALFALNQITKKSRELRALRNHRIDIPRVQRVM